MAHGPMDVRLVSPERVVFEGKATAVTAPAWDGQVGILPGHAPFLTLLGAGELTIELPTGGGERFHVAAGVLKVAKDQVTILTEYTSDEPPEIIPPEAIIHPEDVTDTSAGNPLA